MTFVFHQAALGDFVMIFPLLRALVPVHLVAPWDKANLAAKMIDGVTPHNIERKPDDIDGLRDATRVISFVSNGHDHWASAMREAAPHAELLYGAPPFEAQSVAPRSQPHGPIIMHPGSGGRAKCWPLDRYEALAERIGGVQMVVGEVEAETWPRLPQNAHVLQSLDQLYDTLAGAKAYIGNDSGPTHLAAQMGLPTLALFGPTDPATWAPRGPQVHVIAPPKPMNMAWLTVERAILGYQTLLPLS